jgi:hypothetical protein
MRFSVSLVAEGDREVSLDDVVALADEVAALGGIASGVGAMAYGAQIVVEAAGPDEAVAAAVDEFTAAATRAGLPSWPVTRAETVSESDDFADLEDES